MAQLFPGMAMECMICYEDTDKKGVTTECCGGHYCATCLYRWIKVSNDSNCPHCRSALVDKGLVHSCCAQVRRDVESFMGSLCDFMIQRKDARIAELERHPVIRLQKQLVKIYTLVWTALIAFWRETVKRASRFWRGAVDLVSRLSRSGILLSIVVVLLGVALYMYFRLEVEQEVPVKRFGCWTENSDVCDYSSAPSRYSSTVAGYNSNTFMNVHIVESDLAEIEVYNGYPTPQWYTVDSDGFEEYLHIYIPALRKSGPIRIPCMKQGFVTFSLYQSVLGQSDAIRLEHMSTVVIFRDLISWQDD